MEELDDHLIVHPPRCCLPLVVVRPSLLSAPHCCPPLVLSALSSHHCHHRHHHHCHCHHHRRHCHQHRSHCRCCQGCVVVIICCCSFVPLDMYMFYVLWYFHSCYISIYICCTNVLVGVHVQVSLVAGCHPVHLSENCQRVHPGTFIHAT